MIVINLGVKFFVIQLFIGVEDIFLGVIDFVKMKVVVWLGEELGVKFSYEDIFVDFEELVVDYRVQMIEIIVELDDQVMENYLEGVEFDEEIIKKLIRKGIILVSFVLVMCGLVFKNKGV